VVPVTRHPLDRSAAFTALLEFTLAVSDQAAGEM